MIFYKLCSESNLDDIYEAFKMGFSDYIIKLDMPKEMFIKRFLGPEGNSLSTSHIAYDNNKPVGLILGGIKEYEGIKTMRCGTLCIHPEYRGKGISQSLLLLHKQKAIENGCKQLFLEVIVGNHRAVAFYKKSGYEKVYDLSYFSCSDFVKLMEESRADYEIAHISFDEIKKLAVKTQDIHINWQNDFDYIKKVEGQVCLGAFIGKELIGALSAHPSGRISLLWINPNQRLKGAGSSLISSYVKEYNLKKAAISFPNNAKLEGFVKHIGFNRDSISQYEMYMTL
jgi:ribosomal protein S18 acetylase RimI-like enzyme